MPKKPIDLSALVVCVSGRRKRVVTIYFICQAAGAGVLLRSFRATTVALLCSVLYLRIWVVMLTYRSLLTHKGFGIVLSPKVVDGGETVD